VIEMYESKCSQMNIKECFLTYQVKLDPENRWVKFAEKIPWHKYEKIYEENFKKSHTGEHAYNFRVALGTLLIKYKYDYSDAELIEQIKESKYLQHFLGIQLKEGEEPFSKSLMSFFRKRIDSDLINKINEEIFLEVIKKERSEERVKKK
jgi:IS5 family transposase